MTHLLTFEIKTQTKSIKANIRFSATSTARNEIKLYTNEITYLNFYFFR